MKKFYAGLLSMLLSLASVNAQDMIVTRNGDVIQAKVTKIGTTEVDYKKWSNQDGPTYSIAISSILAINYQNGEKEAFENVVEEKEPAANNERSSNEPTELPTTPDEENAKLIALYNNQEVTYKEKSKKEKLAKQMHPVWGVKSHSVLSDQNVRMDFVKTYCTFTWSSKKITHATIPEGEKYVLLAGYHVAVHNKTDHNIYIDLANSFKIDEKSQSTPYYSNKTFSKNTGGSSGGSLNVGAVTGALGIGGVVGDLAGGVNVGGGKTSGVTVTQQDERILIVPPHATVSLPLEKEVNRKEIIEKEEQLRINSPLQLSINHEQFKELYDENNSPYTLRRIITYSTSAEFNTYHRLNVELYLKAGLGVHWKNFYLNPSSCNATDWNYLLIDGYFVSTNPYK